MKEVFIDWCPVDVDTDAGRLITGAETRISRFLLEAPRISGFAASNYYAAAGVLSALKQNAMLQGLRLCEWGSGFGVVTCLAAQFGYHACGIELEPMLVDAGIPRLTWHHLRYNCGSYLLSENVPITMVSKILGHANPAITMTIYAHELQEDSDLVRQAMAKIVS